MNIRKTLTEQEILKEFSLKVNMATVKLKSLSFDKNPDSKRDKELKFFLLAFKGLYHLEYVDMINFKNIKQTLIEKKEEFKKNLNQLNLEFFKNEKSEESFNLFVMVKKDLKIQNILNYLLKKTTSDLESKKKMLLEKELFENEIRLLEIFKKFHCKICAKKVPLFFFEDHSKNCCTLNQTKEEILKLNKKIISICESIENEALIAQVAQNSEIKKGIKSFNSELKEPLMKTNSDKINNKSKFFDLQKKNTINSSSKNRLDSKKKSPHIINKNSNILPSNKSIFSKNMASKYLDKNLSIIPNHYRNEINSFKSNDQTSLPIITNDSSNSKIKISILSDPQQSKINNASILEMEKNSKILNQEEIIINEKNTVKFLKKIESDSESDKSLKILYGLSKKKKSFSEISSDSESNKSLNKKKKKSISNISSSSSISNITKELNNRSQDSFKSISFPNEKNDSNSHNKVSEINIFNNIGITSIRANTNTNSNSHSLKEYDLPKKKMENHIISDYLLKNSFLPRSERETKDKTNFFRNSLHTTFKCNSEKNNLNRKFSQINNLSNFFRDRKEKSDNDLINFYDFLILVSHYKNKLKNKPLLESYFEDRKLINQNHFFNFKNSPNPQTKDNLKNLLISLLKERIKLLKCFCMNQNKLEKIQNLDSSKKKNRVTLKKQMTRSFFCLKSVDSLNESGQIRNSLIKRVKKNKNMTNSISKKKFRKTKDNNLKVLKKTKETNEIINKKVNELKKAKLGSDNLIKNNIEKKDKRKESSENDFEISKIKEKNLELNMDDEKIFKKISKNSINNENSKTSNDLETLNSSEESNKIIAIKKARSDIIKTNQEYLKDFKTVGLEDFKFIKFIGKGNYGKVYLVKRNENEEYYAMKIIDFSNKLLDKDSINTLRNEIDVFSVLKGDFLAKAYFSFVENNNLCIVMEFMVGGDLRNMLEEYGRFDQETSRFYIAQVILGLSFLHKEKIIHRDLKPENLLLDKKGFLKLADFGFSEFHEKAIQEPEFRVSFNQKNLILNINFQGFSLESLPTISNDKSLLKRKSSFVKIVGTVSYISPEIINRKIKYNKVDNERELFAIDWWAVGCLLYEFLVGITPFGGNTEEEVFTNITNFNMIWPPIGYEEDMITPEAKDIILKFLEIDPLTRLGDLEKIKNHPFFDNFNWDLIKEMKSPLEVYKKSFNDDNKDNKKQTQFSILKQKKSQKIELQELFSMKRTDLLGDNNMEFYLEKKNILCGYMRKVKKLKENIFFDSFK